MSLQKKRLITIMAGGTGGHIFPGLAVAKELIARGYRVNWLGAQGLEEDLVPKAGIELYSLPMKGLRGNGIKGWLSLPFRLWRAVRLAKSFLKKDPPSAVIGFGGFASAPGGIAARFLKIPLLTHEQNAVAGMSNKLLGRLGAVQLAGFSDALKGAKVVGNPVRESLFSERTPQERYEARAEAPLNILVVGGSQGSRRLNQLIVTIAISSRIPLNIWHQTGGKLFEESKTMWEESPLKPYRLAPFIDEMEEAYRWADLVICRAGALTVAELTAVGVASLFIPYPYAVDDHQTENADAVVKGGGALLFQERDIADPAGEALLLEQINQLTRPELLKMAERAHRLAKPNSTKEIADAIERSIK